jgi:serine protease Do
MDTILNRINQELSDVIARVRVSVVQLHQGRHGIGAGVIWNENGLIITNAHVVHRRHSPRVTLWDGRSFNSRLLAQDKQHDLAALQIEADGLSAIPISDSQTLQPGQWVTAVGHPWGVLGAASAGHIIDLGVPIEWNGSERELVQIGIQLRPGHSGGPLVDENGRLIGINTMISGPQVGLAIPLHTVQTFLQTLV